MPFHLKSSKSVSPLNDNAELLSLENRVRFPVDDYDESLHEYGYHPMPLTVGSGSTDDLTLDCLMLLAAVIYRYTLQPCFSLQAHVMDISQSQIAKKPITCQLSGLSVKEVRDLFNSLLTDFSGGITNYQYLPDSYDSSEEYKLLLKKSQLAFSAKSFSFLQIVLPRECDRDSSYYANIFHSTLSEYLQLNSCNTPFFLLLMTGPTNQYVSLVINRRYFSMTSGERLAAHFNRLSWAMNKAKHNDLITTLPMLSPQEIEQQRSACASEHVALPQQNIYEYVEHYSQVRPNSIAVEHGAITLTYRELNDKANQLANYLLSRGVQPHSRIAVYMGPDINIIMTILAIHKIACVYVPLDPGFPEERIAVILEDVLPQLILTCGEVDKSLTDDCDQLIAIDSILIKLADFSNKKPDIVVKADDISHIFFTSGTTGKPKGVVASHKNLIHYILTAKNEYQFDESDRFIAVARFTFSISFFELLSPLVAGGTLRILHRNDVLNLGKLVEHFKWATVFHIGPSLLKKVLPYINATFNNFNDFKHIKHASSGGDMVPPDVLELLKKIFINADVYVIYGSSEISCMGCRYFVPRDHKVSKTLVGKPHANVSLKLIDNQGMPVPVGVIGDILFSGDGLVQGYLNLEQLTREKFIHINGERFYRIGDVGRFDREGNLEILGRQDYQVQIKGMRIELGELDYYLRQIPLVSDAVAGVTSVGDEKTLVAYLVAQDKQMLDLSVIRQFLLKKLPDYMLPTKYVTLDTLPLNHNMKIDRSRLPPPDSSNSLTSVFAAECIKPRNEIDEQLIGIWKKIFKVKNIGIEHDFFEMGGDSLLAVKFLAVVDQVFDRFIPISFLIKNSKLSLIADAIATNIGEDGIGDVVVLKEGDPQLPPLFCFYGVLHYKELAEALNTDRIVCGVYLEEEVGLLQHGEGSQAFKEFSNVYLIAEKYLKRIKQFQSQGPYYIAGHSFGGIVGLEVARKLTESGEQVGLLAMLESWHPSIKKELKYSDRIYGHVTSFFRSPLHYLASKTRIVYKRIINRFDKKANAGIGIDHRAIARKQAIQRYQSKPYKGSVVIYRAENKNPFEPDHPSLGWGKVISDFTVVDIPGDHLGILKKENVKVLARYIDEHLL